MINTRNIYLLKDTYYILELGINLLSTNRLNNITIVFIKENAILYKNKKVILIINRRKYLYIIGFILTLKGKLNYTILLIDKIENLYIK
jgi:hypothetical protein